VVPQNCHPDRSVAQWRDLRSCRSYGRAEALSYKNDTENDAAIYLIS
jgi:hypothetical protein